MRTSIGTSLGIGGFGLVLVVSILDWQNVRIATPVVNALFALGITLIFSGFGIAGWGVITRLVTRKFKTPVATAVHTAPMPSQPTSRLFTVQVYNRSVIFIDKTLRLRTIIDIKAFPPMQVEALYLVIGDKQGQSDWESRQINGSFDGYMVDFEIPKGVVGQRTAHISAIVDGVLYQQSPTFQIDVPKR